MKLLLTLTIGLMLSACTVVSQGEAGIVTEVDGEISNTLRTQGFEIVVLDSMQKIDLTQNTLRINNITARDSDSIPLKELDVNLTFNTNAEKVIEFYKKTRSITEVKDDNGHDDHILGYTNLRDMLINEIQKSIAKFKSKDITSNRESIEAEIKESLQKMSNERYGEIFVIVNLNLNTVKLNDDIEKSLQAIQVTRNQQLEIQAQREQVELKKELLNSELKAKADAVSKYGISMKDYLAYEVKRDFNKAISNTQVQVHVNQEQ